MISWRGYGGEKGRLQQTQKWNGIERKDLPATVILSSPIHKIAGGEFPEGELREKKEMGRG